MIWRYYFGYSGETRHPDHSEKCRSMFISDNAFCQHNEASYRFLNDFFEQTESRKKIPRIIVSTQKTLVLKSIAQTWV